MQSIVQQLGNVPFPTNTFERVYMREFRKADGLPFDLARWQPTVDAMLSEVDTDGPIYLMVDQGLVKAGTTQRRPDMHIDGYWHPAKHAHGGNTPGGGHLPSAPPSPGRHVQFSGHGSHSSQAGYSGGWGSAATYGEREAITLASDIAACRVLIGDFNGAPGEGGDCSHIDLSGLRSIILAPNIAYAGNVTMLHESLPVPMDCLRTVVRLNVPGWTPLS